MKKRRIAIVTGVSRLNGIGRAICLELAKRDCDVFFTYWKKYDKQMPWGVKDDEPDIIQKEIIALGVKCEKLEFDMTSEKSAEFILASVNTRLGWPSILINNATYSTTTTIEKITAEQLDKHYYLNVMATTLLTILFIRQFRYNNGGRIINLTSGQSLGQMSNEIAYAMTKSAIESLTYTLSSEIAKKGITINAVNPGPNNTGWMDAQLKKDLLKRFPMNRVGQPSDTANLVGFLASEEAEWITGQVIHSEGGFMR